MISHAVQEMLNNDRAPTAPLKEFLEAEREDPQLWWRLDSGHMQNVFEEAVRMLDDAGLLEP